MDETYTTYFAHRSEEGQAIRLEVMVPSRSYCPIMRFIVNDQILFTLKGASVKYFLEDISDVCEVCSGLL